MKAVIVLALFGAARAGDMDKQTGDVAEGACFLKGPWQFKTALHGSVAPSRTNNSAAGCQKSCELEANCFLFSYWPSNKNCWFYGKNPGIIASTPAGAEVIRGEAPCPPPATTAAATTAAATTVAPTAKPANTDNSGSGDSGSTDSGSGSAAGSSNPEGSMGIKSSGDSLPGSSGSGYSGSGTSSSNPWWLLLAIPVAGLAALPVIMGKKKKTTKKTSKKSSKGKTKPAAAAPAAEVQQPLMDPVPTVQSQVPILSTFSPITTAVAPQITSMAPPVISSVPMTSISSPIQTVAAPIQTIQQPMIQSFQQPTYAAQPAYYQPGLL